MPRLPARRPLPPLQAAEERALAGKCGNPLCAHPPARASGGAAPPRRRYQISAREQAVYELAGAEPPTYCSPDCEAAVRQLAARLGSGALALDRFAAMYDELKRREAEVTGAAQQAQQAQQTAQAAQAAQAAQQQQGAQQAQQGALPQQAGGGGRDSDPGGIAGTPLVPRLAVEQVEVKHIGSSAGQFGDFSRKPRQRPAGEVAPRPKGVLKKQSQFAAGSAKVPIMLAEVKVRG